MLYERCEFAGDFLFLGAHILQKHFDTLTFAIAAQIAIKISSITVECLRVVQYLLDGLKCFHILYPF
jgi:hypothetical protein